MFFDEKLSKAALMALDRLEEKGFSAYIVGGAVRDIYMNKTPKDFDITTSACPDDIIKTFADFRVIETGKRFGTVTVILGGESLEITTYRRDGDYLNNRSPENVFYSRDISEDLKRRDFTVNAIAYSPRRGCLDLFCGAEDIKNQIIRTIGNADERFSEDALRILRALRFSSVLGFEIEETTEKSIFRNRNLLSNISKERIRDEFNKIITGIDTKKILLRYRSIIEVFIPELKDCSECTYQSTINILSKMPDETDLRLSVLFRFLKAEKASDILKNLKYDNNTIKTVNFLITHQNDLIVPEKAKIKFLLNKFGIQNTKKLFDFKIACENQSGTIFTAQKLTDDVLNNDECFSLKALKINGNDLKNLGISGENIGIALDYALNEVIYERTENDKECLEKAIKNFFKGELVL